MAVRLEPVQSVGIYAAVVAIVISSVEYLLRDASYLYVLHTAGAVLGVYVGLLLYGGLVVRDMIVGVASARVEDVAGLVFLAGGAAWPAARHVTLVASVLTDGGLLAAVHWSLIVLVGDRKAAWTATVDAPWRRPAADGGGGGAPDAPPPPPPLGTGAAPPGHAWGARLVAGVSPPHPDVWARIGKEHLADVAAAAAACRAGRVGRSAVAVAVVRAAPPLALVAATAPALASVWASQWGAHVIHALLAWGRGGGRPAWRPRRPPSAADGDGAPARGGARMAGGGVLGKPPAAAAAVDGGAPTPGPSACASTCARLAAAAAAATVDTVHPMALFLPWCRAWDYWMVAASLSADRTDHLLCALVGVADPFEAAAAVAAVVSPPGDPSGGCPSCGGTAASRVEAGVGTTDARPPRELLLTFLIAAMNVLSMEEEEEGAGPFSTATPAAAAVHPWRRPAVVDPWGPPTTDAHYPPPWTPPTPAGRHADGSPGATATPAPVPPISSAGGGHWWGRAAAATGAPFPPPPYARAVSGGGGRSRTPFWGDPSGPALLTVRGGRLATADLLYAHPADLRALYDAAAPRLRCRLEAWRRRHGGDG